jgi:hypothetical protein
MTPDNPRDISLRLLDSPALSPREQTFAAPKSAELDVHLSARALLVFVFMLMIFTLASRQIIDPDFWWHLRTGQYLIETRSLPSSDIFSALFFGKEWVTHEWLSEVLIYSVYRAFGYGGLIVAFSLIITSGFAIAYRLAARSAGHVYVTGPVVLLGALAAAPTWGVRPQVISFLFASLLLKVLDDFQRNVRNRSIWWLIPLMALWVNLHAGFAVGIVLILTVIVGTILDGKVLQGSSLKAIWHRVRKLVFVLGGCVLAVLLNPSGPRIYSYPFETLTSQAMMKFIEEWRTPNFHELMFQPLALFILAVFGALALSGKKITFTQLLLLLGTAWAMLRSGRNVPFFVLVATPLLAERVWDLMTSHSWGRWLTVPETREVGNDARVKVALNILLLVIVPLTLAAFRVQQTVAGQSTVEGQRFPTAAVEFMRANRPPQPVYNEYHWGGYLIWKLYPDYRVYIDGRADVYGDAFFEEFMSTHAGEPNWRASLEKHGVRTVLLQPDAALASLLRQDQEWAKVFEDNQAVIFVKK